VLKQLTIKNYALIKSLEMNPSGGLNVITGETGAGKSIMLGALGLLLGNRADTKVLWDESEKCVTEGEFDVKDYRLKSFFKEQDLDYADLTVLRREVSANGKSRAFINDTPVTLDVLKKLASRLMDIHSQHETLDLGSRTFQLQLIDAYSGNEKLLEKYALAWSSYVDTKSAYDHLLGESTLLKQESDYVLFQLNEIKKGNWQANEQAALETELKIQEHAEEIKTRFKAAVDTLSQSEYATLTTLAEVRAQLNAVANYSPAYAQLLQRVESVRIELNDVVQEIEREDGAIEFDPARLNEVKERLSALYQLLQKHKLKTIAELLALQESLEEKAQKTSNLDESLQALKVNMEQAQQEVQAQAEHLSTVRLKVFTPLCNKIKNLLKELGIPDAQLKTEHTTTTPGPTGIDQVEILFSANKGIAPRPLAQVASGGEFARLMFCAKYTMAEKTAMPTLVLDEIDTGVSGEVAVQLGNLMKEMGGRHQVIAISHLPQIAGKGDSHFFVYKDNSEKKTVSLIKKLSTEERIEEIAKMIGGSKPSKSALENARELISR
jgi:DNA repair protein RecN (Recombination protein N)